MVKDKRYKTVKILIETGNVAAFRDIFEHIPKTTVAEELGIHFNRMSRMIDKVSEIKMSDVYLFSGYFEVEPNVMFGLIDNQHGAKKASTRKKNWIHLWIIWSITKLDTGNPVLDAIKQAFLLVFSLQIGKNNITYKILN